MFTLMNSEKIILNFNNNMYINNIFKNTIELVTFVILYSYFKNVLY